MKRKIVAGIMALALTVSMLPVNVGAAPKAATKSENVQEKASMNQRLKLWYTEPADVNSRDGAGAKWMQESLPLGNGTLGNLIFGGISKERIHFNEKTLWTGGPAPSRPDYDAGNRKDPYTAEEIEEYRQVLDDHSQNVFNDPLGVGLSAPIRFPAGRDEKGSYQDFGDIWIDYTPSGITDSKVSNYRRELDIQTGIASTEFTYKKVDYKREHFVSEPDNVMVTKLTASKAGKLSVDISMNLNNSGLTNEPSMDAEKNTYSIQGMVKDNELKFRTTMKVVPTGGTITADEEKGVYHVENADSVMIVMAAETDYINEFPTYRDTEKDLVKVVDDRAIKNAKKDYDDLKAVHVADHQELFDRVELDLGEDSSNVPTDKLIDQYRNGDYSKYLEVLSFQYGRYLSIAGSRGILPSNLVGLWTLGAAAWTGDYHFNINLQMNYWPVYVTNLAECGKTFIDYVGSLREPGRITAERVHGIENATKDHTGFVVHLASNPFGMTVPTNSQECGWNPAGLAWAMQNVWQDYEFTEDSTYLKEKMYPMMKEAALFWDNYLWESQYQKIDDKTSSHNGENRLVVAPSLSAEQGPTVNGSTYDQSLVWELYKECIEAGKIVGEDEKVLEGWADKMERLDPVNVSESGGVKEWYEESRVGTETGHNQSYAKAGDLTEVKVPNSGWHVGHPGEQRHASHLVGLYPGTLINKDNQEYMDAAVQSLNERGFYSTGWSKANKVNLWARTGNGNNAYKVLNNLIGGNASGLQYNLFDSHGNGGGDTMMGSTGSPVWQIDGNYGLTAGVAEMLIQSQLGYTQFLPAIPDAWANGSVSGLKARGNFTIGEKWSVGLPKEFTVCYEGEKESRIFTGEYENIENAKVYADGKEVVFTVDEETGHISFEALKGKTYTIDMRGTTSAALKEKAEAYLTELHPDLTAVKEELQKAIDSDSKDLASVLEKATMMNELYPKYLKNAEKVYYLTAENGVSLDDIDEIYCEMRELKEKLLNNTGDIAYYESAAIDLQKAAGIIDDQMLKRVVSFSKESGAIGSDDATLNLSKHESAEKYDIRYTLDGSIPYVTSELYEKSIELSTEQNTTVRAALFYREQRISPVYTKQYSPKAVVESLEANMQDLSAFFSLDKMIDGNMSSRWVPKDPSGDIIVDFKFAGNREINTMHLEQYISAKNFIKDLEIQALKDGEYVTVYSGTAEVVGGQKIAFDAVTTDALKLILKEGYVTPHLYEVQFFMNEEDKEPAADAENLKAMISLADAADRNSKDYADAKDTLKTAFEESIKDAKASTELTQAQMDSRETFLRNRFIRIGFGKADKSELETLIAKADQELNGEYTKDSLYWLKKANDHAKEIMADEEARQSEVDLAAEAIWESLHSLVNNFEYTDVPVRELEGGSGWTEYGGYKYTIKDDAGPLTYTFEGKGIKVLTKKRLDYGVLRAVITDAEGKEVYNKETDTQGDVKVGVTLLEENLPEGNYTIRFERVGKSPNAPNKPGMVNVGSLTIKKSIAESVDRSVLEAELKNCEGLNEEEYSVKSWEAFQSVLKDAKAVYEKEDQDTCTAEMEDWASRLAATRENLAERVDLTELQKALEEAKAIKADGYTEESYQALQEVIADVEAFLNGNFNQNEADAKTNMLRDAIAGLKVDKTKLQEIYDEIKDMEQGNITDKSWEDFLTLKEEIEKVLNDETATPEQVAEILKKLEDFEFEYVEKPEKPEEPVKPVKPDNKPGNGNGNGSAVETGDTTSIVFYLAGAFAAVIMVAVMVRRKEDN